MGNNGRAVDSPAPPLRVGEQDAVVPREVRAIGAIGGLALQPLGDERQRGKKLFARGLSALAARMLPTPRTMTQTDQGLERIEVTTTNFRHPMIERVLLTNTSKREAKSQGTFTFTAQAFAREAHLVHHRPNQIRMQNKSKKNSTRQTNMTTAILIMITSAPGRRAAATAALDKHRKTRCHVRRDRCAARSGVIAAASIRRRQCGGVNAAAAGAAAAGVAAAGAAVAGAAAACVSTCPHSCGPATRRPCCPPREDDNKAARPARRGRRQRTTSNERQAKHLYGYTDR